MPRFEMKESRRKLTSYAGLSLVGQCFVVAQASAWLDGRIPVSTGMKSSDVIKSMVGLLCLGKNDFDAIEPFRQDRFFRDALTIAKVPSAEWLRQRLNGMAGAVCEHAAELSVRLLERAQAPVSAHLGYVRLDFDTFTIDTLAVNVLRRILPRALVNADLSVRIVAEVLAQIALNVQKFVPERQRPRSPRDKPHKFHAYKPAV